MGKIKWIVSYTNLDIISNILRKIKTWNAFSKRIVCMQEWEILIMINQTKIIDLLYNPIKKQSE